MDNGELVDHEENVVKSHLASLTAPLNLHQKTAFKGCPHFACFLEPLQAEFKKFYTDSEMYLI